MHYCQSCDEPTPMRPQAGEAWCPGCGQVDAAAALEPLFVVTGASGSGKTSVLGPLARLLAGRCVTFDMDWLIDPATALAAERPLDWSALRNAWLAVAHGVAQSGMPTVLLGPLIPEHLEVLSCRQWVGEIHFLVLDCPDDVRRERITARPVWRSRDIDEQIDFGRWLRTNIADRVDTSQVTPTEAANTVAAWVIDWLPSESRQQVASADLGQVLAGAELREPSDRDDMRARPEH